MAVDYYYSYNHDRHKVEEQREEEDDDYIDMEVSSFTTYFPLSNTTSLSPSSQNSREFEFHMSSLINLDKNTSTSPADELFYMGKLLPLHLPPRLQLVEKILHDSTLDTEFYNTPLSTDAAVTPATCTPFESCCVSPVESRRISRELKPEEYFGVYSDDHKRFISEINRVNKSWTKKLKTKIKALFGKSDEIYSSAVKRTDERSNSKAKDELLEKQIKGTKDNPFTKIMQVIPGARFQKQNDTKESKIFHRKSFARALNSRYYTTRVSSSVNSCSSSSSSSSSFSSLSSTSASSNSNELDDYPLVQRNSSANFEIEASLIQGAIAHCKQSSEQAVQVRKTFV